MADLRIATAAAAPASDIEARASTVDLLIIPFDTYIGLLGELNGY